MAALAHAAKEEVGHFGNAVKLALKIASTEQAHRVFDASRLVEACQKDSLGALTHAYIDQATDIQDSHLKSLEV